MLTWTKKSLQSVLVPLEYIHRTTKRKEAKQMDLNAMIRISGFGFITVKQAFGEVKYFAAAMQEAYKTGKLEIAIQNMRAMRPFVDALRKAGYSIEQILPN